MKQRLSSAFSFFGVDASSQELVISRYPNAQQHSISNDKKSIAGWLKTLAPNSALAVEATGSYHRELIRLAHAAGVVCFLLNPKDVKHYGRAAGLRAKTDAVDAALIARYCAKEHMELHVWKPSPTTCDRVLELITRRANVVKATAMLKQSFKGLKGFRGEMSQTTQRMQRMLDKLDQAITVASDALPKGQAEMVRLQTIPGVGLLTSSYLLSTFVRIPFANSDATIAFAGLDPRANDSGTKTGRRRLSKRGPAELRRLLYNAAMSGVKTSTWKPFYQRARDAGKTTTEALIIVARKILRLAFSLYRNKTEFDPKQCVLPTT
jgi:transposase